MRKLIFDASMVANPNYCKPHRRLTAIGVRKNIDAHFFLKAARIAIPANCAVQHECNNSKKI